MHVCNGSCRGLDIKPDYANVASVVFSSPQVAQVGVNEDKAVEQYGDVDVFTSTFSCVPSCLPTFPHCNFSECKGPIGVIAFYCVLNM